METTGALLHERFPALRERLPFVRLGEGPSPVWRLEGLDAGGAEVWVKDEGAYGGPWGGNKVRKLEWVLPDVRRRRRRTVLTFGALGTNHGLATALYARELGLGAALALVDQPVDDHVRAQLARLRESGAALHFTHTRARTVAAVVVNDLLRLDGRVLGRLAGRSARLLRRRGAALPERAEVRPSDLTVTRDWLGAGYGRPTTESEQARAIAATAGLELDPVYTAKALAGLRGRAETGRLGGGPVLFLQTHGPRPAG